MSLSGKIIFLDPLGYYLVEIGLSVLPVHSPCTESQNLAEFLTGLYELTVRYALQCLLPEHFFAAAKLAKIGIFYGFVNGGDSPLDFRS